MFFKIYYLGVTPTLPISKSSNNATTYQSIHYRQKESISPTMYIKKYRRISIIVDVLLSFVSLFLLIFAN